MQLPSLPMPSLHSTVNKLENSIITISGPAIAISGIIAGVDLLTGGSMFRDIQWLSLTWAICLLITLDFNVLMLGARARRVYHGNKVIGHKVAEIILITAIAGAISSVSVQMQSIIARTQATTAYSDATGQHVRNLTIDEATRDMGIDPVALIWERSALVLVLIFMSGWFRDEEPSRNNAQLAQPVPASLTREDVEQLLSAMQAAHAQSIASLAQQLSATQQSVRVTVDQATRISVEALRKDLAQTLPDTEDLAAQLRDAMRSELGLTAQSLASDLRNELLSFAQQAVRIEEVAHESMLAQRTTQPMLEAAQSAQDNGMRNLIFAYFDAHGGTAQVSNDDLVTALKCSVHQARRARTDYNKLRGTK